MNCVICNRVLTGFLTSVVTGTLLIACSATPSTPPTAIANQPSTTITATETALPAATVGITPTTTLTTATSIESPTEVPAEEALDAETIDVVETDVQYIQSLAEVNMRSGPSTDYATVGNIFAGQTILVTGVTPDNSWWRVICPDDSVGNCFVINDPNLVEPASATGASTDASSEAAAGTTTTYADAGYTFDYPSSWTILGDPQQGTRGSILQLVSWTPAPGASTDETPAGGSRMDVALLDWDPKNDLAAYVAIRKQAWTASGMTIDAEETLMLPGEHPAMRFLVTAVGSDAQSLILLTTVGEQYLTLNGYGDIPTIDAIAQTLQIQP